MTNDVEEKIEDVAPQQEVDFKALFIKERYERLQIEGAAIQKRFAEIQREMGDIEKMNKAAEAISTTETPEVPIEG